ncbi:YdhR family protein [Deinococcus apachensis]|uniref:YdhR family protein n=1 Tax=Deinococcus apachensis TaxID=309886 RepID=UPI00036FDA49|nr:YdhR family protein [Deinococcus apachensis]
MRVQIITFQLQGLSAAEYREMCSALAKSVSALPGCLSKIWLEDEASNRYGGVYVWRDDAAMTAAMASDLMQAVANHPNLSGFETHDFGVLEEPSRVTRGLPERVPG